MPTYHDRLKELRKKENVTQKQLSELLNITTRNYQRYETGEVDPPTSKTVFLANYFQVSTDYLLGLSDSPSK